MKVTLRIIFFIFYFLFLIYLFFLENETENVT